MSAGEHPFDHLAPGPYRVVGVAVRRGPLTTTMNGVEVQVGAPGQPMGSCQHCGQGIAEVWTVAGSNGTWFEVGCECVRKASVKLAADGRRAAQQARRADKKRRTAARVTAAWALLKDPDLRLTFHNQPHPNPSMAAAFSRLDHLEYLLDRAGDSGRNRACRMIEKAAAAAGKE